MGGGDQFLGIGALLVLEAGLERIRRLGEYAGLTRYLAGAITTGALPDCCCLADHLDSPVRLTSTGARYLGKATLARPPRRRSNLPNATTVPSAPLPSEDPRSGSA